jgi:hypothetical protein
MREAPLECGDASPLFAGVEGIYLSFSRKRPPSLPETNFKNQVTVGYAGRGATKQP